MRILFMGTPEIAVPCLEKLHAVYEVVGVVTQTDKPKGRGHKLAMSAVKEKALELGLPVYQPQTLKDGAFQQVLDQCRPELIAVIAYGKILPKYVLDYPKYGCINVHASLLPKYRGAAPIQWAVVNGEKVSGVTTMLMEEGLDTGDMLLTREVPITDTMTAGDLHDALCAVCPDVLVQTIEQIETIMPRKQDDSLSCYASMLNKENTRIDWEKTAVEIYNLVRGMNPFPTAHTRLGEKGLKVYKCRMSDKKGACGAVLSTEDGLTVGCRDGSITITELQLEGKKRMPAADFLRGYPVQVGEQLG